MGKENDYWKQIKRNFFSTKDKDEAPLLNKKTNARLIQVSGKQFYNLMEISNSGKRSLLKFGRFKIGCMQ